MTKSLPQLAPGHDDADAFKEGDGDRPDDPHGLLVVVAQVVDAQLALLADRLADEAGVDAIERHSRPRHREQAGVFDAVAQAIRQDGLIFATASAAARASGASGSCATQREPSISASISSSRNMSGGSMKPGRITNPTPASPAMAAPCATSVSMSR